MGTTRRGTATAMATVLGVHAVFHDRAAALGVDAEIAATEEERLTRREHGKEAVPFSTWEVPEHAARWCLEHAGLGAEELDAVTYPYEPAEPALLADPSGEERSGIDAESWEPVRTLYAREAPRTPTARARDGRSGSPRSCTSTVRHAPRASTPRASHSSTCSWTSSSAEAAYRSS
jgi:carbamoyltransferase